MSRRLCTALALIALLLPATQALAGDLKKVAVGVDWFIDPNHGPLVVALERGFFADEGLDVTLVPPESTTDNVTMVLDGRVAIGMSDQPRTQMEIGKGSPLMIIGTLISQPLNVVLGVEGGPVTSIEDLRGKRIGYADSETIESDLLRLSLAAHGIEMSDVTLVNVGFDMVPALLEGKVDVLTDAYGNFEPIQVELAGQKPLVLDIEKGAMPTYSELVYIVDTAVADPDVINRFLTAVERGVQAIVDDPEASWALFIKYAPKLDNALNRTSWDQTVPLFATRPSELDKERYASFATFLVASEIVASMPAVEDYLYSP